MTYPRFSLTLRRTLVSLICFILFAAFAALTGTARAGGGPENLLLVVNPNSSDSLTIANHYARLRQVPATNIFYLSWDPKADTTDVETFRQQILKPVIEAARERRPAGQIDYIIYSADFPWAVRLDADKEKLDAKLSGGQAAGKPLHTGPSVYAPTGSISGLTYLWVPVLAGDPAYMQLQSNFYMRRPVPQQKDAPSLGFKSTYRFGPQGELEHSNHGRHYFLSMMLGVTAGRGNTVAEVLNYLTRSAAADGTHPRRTIYYVENNTARSLPRHAGYAEAARELKALGVEADIFTGSIPMQKPDVQGLMAGLPVFDWKASGSTILPGAICEHLTSYGGIMAKEAGQTPLSEFLRYGAAGASGTVVEPMAIGAKFPAAALHVHYARGCTLAESFYQSVFGPFQLLIVGDPLCRPWADVPQVTVAGVQSGATVKGKLTLTPAAHFARGGRAEHFELFVDGLRSLACGPGGPLELDTTKLGDGYHELRVVAIGAGPIHTQGRKILEICTANHNRTIEVSHKPATITAGQPLVLTAKSAGSIGVAVFQGTRLVGRIPGDIGRVEVKPSLLGSGPVRLQVIGLGGSGRQSNVNARPIEMTVE